MTLRAPDVEKRRAAQFEGELVDRAKAWIPDWGVDDDEGPRDFGRALLKVAARFSSEVAQRLDKAGDKMLRGFYDWLGVRGQAARPARMPVVFKMVEKAARDVLALAPVSLQVDVGNDSVVFETEGDVRLVPGRLTRLVAVDADMDAFYLPPPGFTDIEAAVSADEWRLKNFAAKDARQVQLDAETGLATELLLEIGRKQYRIQKVEKDIVTLDPPLEQAFHAGTVVRRVTRFTPFDGARNRQSHALYIGDSDVLDIESQARIDVIGAQALVSGFKWQYWGKAGKQGDADWQDLGTPVLNQEGDGITLSKPQGSMEEQPYGPAKKSRWLRARIDTLKSGTQPLAFESLTLAVNRATTPPPCPATGVPSADTPTVEAMSNTTPLTITNLFYPLGREPRQFDAFYVGSKEAFSKKNAKVSLCCEMADPTFVSLAAVRDGAWGDKVFAGIGRDRALHLVTLDANKPVLVNFHNRDALRPPSPDLAKGNVASAPIDLETECAPFVHGLPNDDFEVVVAAGNKVWKWYENANNVDAAGWSLWYELPDEKARIDDIVPLYDGRDVAVRSAGKLWTSVNAPGTQLLPAANQSQDLASIGPMLDVSAAGGDLRPGSGLVGITDGGKLVSLTADGTETDHGVGGLDRGTKVEGRYVGGIRPLRVTTPMSDVAVGIGFDAAGQAELRAAVGTSTGSRKVAGKILSKRMAAQLVSSNAQFSFARSDAANPQESYVTSWIPGHPKLEDVLIDTPIPPGVGTAAGSPLITAGRVLVPGEQQQVYVAVLQPTAQEIVEGAATDAVVVAGTVPALGNNDVLALGPTFEPRRIKAGPFLGGTENAYLVSKPWDLPVSTVQGYVFRAASGGYGLFSVAGTAPASPRVNFDSGVPLPQQDEDILVLYGSTLGIFTVNDVHAATTAGGVTTPANAWLAPPGLLPVNTAMTFWRIDRKIAMTPHPAIAFYPQQSWDATRVAAATLHFAGANPSEQEADLWSNGANRALLLRQGWTIRPATDAAVIEAAITGFQQFTANPATYPALSWEYWNGSAWWSLPIDDDATSNFKSTGVISFHVPPDLQSSDWAGKTNYWVRARLVAGDYGKEEVLIKGSPPNPAGVQTIDRITDGIKPPVMLRLSLSYSTEDAHMPDYVLAEDSGSIRDQSDANRTKGAKVEAFVALAVSLGRLEGSATPAKASIEPCPPECECPDTTLAQGPAAAVSTAAPASASAAVATGRALLLGVEGAVADGPVNVLAMIGEEKDQDTFAPMRAAALADKGFETLVAEDRTRALGESGLVTLDIPDMPKEAELFGDTRRWIRLAPTPAAGEWNPSIAGLYLNGAWASARETLTRELLGSSEGAPDLVLQLARPPVLRGSLELRVKEPLGEEQRKALLDEDARSVLDDPNLGAGWVLWKQVIDPADEDADARVYAFDEASGFVRFGDGRHGMIPPIGRDSIVVFRYQRTEPPSAGASDVPGNGVEAREKLNLVTPLESVEAAFSAEHSAGGTPPESDERVLRFAGAHLRHRERALSLQDLEDLALASSPAIAQARALRRGTGVRLVAVMRGTQPAPTRPQRRELARLLLEAAPPSLAPEALTIAPARLRRLHLELRLRVERLDDSGRLQDDAKARLLAFFDPASGGRTKTGWPLGVSPTLEDVAFALLDAPGLESMESLEAYEALDDGTLGAWPAALQPDELAWLERGAMRFEFVAQKAAA